MPLDLTPSVLRREITSSLKLRRDTTNKSREDIRRYAEGGRESWEKGDATFDNHNFEWIANVVPSLVFANPSVRLTDMGVQDIRTKVVEWGMRSNIIQTRLNNDLTACAYDIQFDFAAGIVVLEPTPGHLSNGSGFTPMRPRFKRLSPRQVFRDSRGPELGKGRFDGHIFVRDRDDMLAEMIADENGNMVPKYDATAVMELTESDGLDELRRDLMQDGIFLADAKNQVVCFEVCVHDANGTGLWLTMGFGSGSDAKFLRAEREYRGPEGGPYCFFGTYMVPDQVYPLANLAVTRKMVDEINKHRWQMSQDAGVAKQIGIVNAASPGVVGNIQDAKSGDILSLPGFSGVVNTMKFGGAMKETYEYVEFAMTMKDRLSGLSSMQRGELSGVTAREVDEASAYTDIRLKYAQNRFKEDVSFGPLAKMADYLYNNDSVAFPCMIEGENGAPPIKGTFVGGMVKPDPAYPWKPNLNVVIEPYSMEYVNQRQLRDQMIAHQQQVIALVQAQAAMPALNGRAMVNDLAQTMNISSGADRYVNWDLLMIQMAQQMAAQQAQTQMDMEMQSNATAQSAQDTQAQDTQAGPEGRSRSKGGPPSGTKPQNRKQPARAGAARSVHSL